MVVHRQYQQFRASVLHPVHLGILAETADLAYLRGETAQGIFINFKNITDSSRVRLPFGVGQMGKSFRNEITKGQSIFRKYGFLDNKTPVGK